MTAAHDVGCPRTATDHCDAAKRLADHYTLHLVAGGHQVVGQWMRAALADGDSDGVLYASRQAAVAHCGHNEDRYCFVQIGPSSMSACQGDSLLIFHRSAYQAGFRLSDPEQRGGGRQVIPRLTREDQRAQVMQLLGRGRQTNLRLL